MTAKIRPAGLVLAALLLIAGCGGSASTGHTARSACQQQAGRIQTLLTQYRHDSGDGSQLKGIADLNGARAFWDRMHKAHCPASSYAQANRALRGFGISF